jgi:hypothetical protein
MLPGGRAAVAARAGRRGDRVMSECPLLAQSGHPNRSNECPLSDAKRTLLGHSDSQPAELLKAGNSSKSKRK